VQAKEREAAVRVIAARLNSWAVQPWRPTAWPRVLIVETGLSFGDPAATRTLGNGD
jgi:hypothetical protein